jgi:hypothetical protein
MTDQINVPERAASERRFFGWMALAVLATAFLGFSRTFYLKPLFPDHPAPAESLFLVHGLAFTAWVLLLYAQTRFISARRIDLHRTAGTFGAGLAAVMVVLGVWGALVAARRATGFVSVPVPPLQFLLIPLTAITMFTLFCALGIALRRDAQSHKRLMVLASVQLLGAAIARLPVISGFGPPAFFGIQDLFLVALAIWDFRTRGRLHPVTLWGGVLMIASQPAQLVLSGTGTWVGIAKWLTGLFG